MKTPFAALAFLLTASPAVASLNMSNDMELAVAPQPASFGAQPVAMPEPACGETRPMIFILRDPSGAIVAMGVAEAAPSC